MSIAIVKDGKVVMAKGYGVRKMGEAAWMKHAVRKSVETPKAFTHGGAGDVGGRRERFRGTTKYMNGWRDLKCMNPYVSHEMTIRDLLTHRSGMVWAREICSFWPHTTFTREEIIYKLRFMKRPQVSGASSV